MGLVTGKRVIVAGDDSGPFLVRAEACRAAVGLP